MLVSTSIIFPSANSIDYLVSTVDGTMSLKRKILAEVRLLSTRFHVIAIIVSIALTSGLSEVLSGALFGLSAKGVVFLYDKMGKYLLGFGAYNTSTHDRHDS
ncbi:hypothetical protein Tco_1507354 [Tanacetum coccineum]